MSFATDGSQPDRPQAVKTGAVTPPLCGFGLDGLMPPGLALQAHKGGLGAHSGPNPDRYARINHALGNGCDNARAVDRKDLESRVLTGRRDRMMTPEIAAEATRAYTQVTNRLNRQRRSSAESICQELAETNKAIAEIVRVIEQGDWHRALSDRAISRECIFEVGPARAGRLKATTRFCDFHACARSLTAGGVRPRLNPWTKSGRRPSLLA